MEDEAKRGRTIQHDGGEPLPALIVELNERWLALSDGDPIAALVITAEELTLLAPATGRGFLGLPPIEHPVTPLAINSAQESGATVADLTRKHTVSEANHSRFNGLRKKRIESSLWLLMKTETGRSS